MKNRSVINIKFLIIVLLALSTERMLLAFPRDMVIQNIKGPWELVVSLGTQDAGISFPVEVTDEDKRQRLNKVLPVMGSPLQIKVLEYYPDLKWKSIITEDSKRGAVASIAIAGGGIQQQVDLFADVPEKRAVTASIGGLSFREIHNTSAAQSLLEKMAKKKAAGLLVFWTDPNNPPQEYVVKKGDSFQIPGTSYTADILEYMPHYSIDRETKEVRNYSDQPVNPALKVRLSDRQNTFEQWVWSNFSTPPHSMAKFPMRVEFSDFDTGPSKSRYFIIAGGEAKLWLYYANGNDIQVEEAEMHQAYPFKNKDYTFTLNTVLAHGTLDRELENGSEKLQHPALVVSVESDKGTQEAVVELNQPAHVKTPYGTLILYYRQKTETMQNNS
ncbi:MAG: hypothetical protein OEV87_07965 [Phycisphaerae bacterium]|nr:hypothetical protein [Phycisphaerae bacterium]